MLRLEELTEEIRWLLSRLRALEKVREAAYLVTHPKHEFHSGSIAFTRVSTEDHDELQAALKAVEELDK